MIRLEAEQEGENAMELKKKPVQSCETCYHYVYDEDYACHTCECGADEDEMVRFHGGNAECPFYRFDDEYISVRKQI